jgi:magnesium transporter
MDTGGNAGSQASVTIIRGMALSEISMKNILIIIWKELRVSLLCGIVLAVANFIKILVVDNLIFGNDISMSVAAVVCITLVVVVFTAKIIGSTLPILAKRIGFDPAVMASPFITTIVDAIALLVYFNIAKLLIENL